MKKLVLLVSAFTTGLLSMGCNNDDSENDPALLPELKIDGETTIVVPYVGGSYTIRYTLENVENGRPYADASCDWITVLSHTETEAQIKIDPLVDVPRTGTVTLSYPECNNIIVTFNQKEIDPFAESISLSVEQITMNSATVVVSNPYEEYWVCPRVETKSFYDMQIAPDPAKWIATYCDKNSSIGMFMSWRTYYYQNYNNNPKTFPDYYSISKADGNSHTFSNLQPDTEYVAFGMEVDPFCNATGGNRLQRLYHRTTAACRDYRSQFRRRGLADITKWRLLLHRPESHAFEYDRALSLHLFVHTHAGIIDQYMGRVAELR